MIDLAAEDVRRDPYPLYERLRAVAPVVHDPRGDLWLVLDHEGVKRVLADHETFSSRAAPSGGEPLDWLIFQDPPRHTKLRAIVTRAFTPRVVSALEPRIRELAVALLERAVASGEVDLAAELTVPLPLIVIAEMMGIPSADWPRFRRWSDAILRLSDTVAGGAEAAAGASAAFRAATAEMRDYLPALVAERRAARRDDLFGRLVAAEVDGEHLGPEDLLAFFQLLLVAGNETTTNLIGNAVVAFVEHPAAVAAIRATPALLPSAIEEVLRWRSPVQAMFRTTRREITLHGAAIPAGKLVLAMIGAANRDPAVFPDPARLHAARDPNPHVAFGHGVHFCLGAPLSRLEARVVLGELLVRVERVELAGPWEPRKPFHVHGPARLPVRLVPR